MTIRVLIADDHSVVREGLRMFLGRDPDLAVVGEAADGVEAVKLARELRPDVVLMDLLMPVMDGIAATAAIRSALPETEVIALTSVLESAAVVGAARAGAIGYLLKDTQAPELRRAIKAAAAGQVQLSPQASAYLLREVRAVELRHRTPSADWRGHRQDPCQAYSGEVGGAEPHSGRPVCDASWSSFRRTRKEAQSPALAPSVSDERPHEC